MAIKTKELKDDAIVSIKVNKSFYLMAKNLSFHLFRQLPDDKREDQINNLKNKEYKDLSTEERNFYTIGLLLVEIERQAEESNQLEDKEILEPGDEGYIAPKLD
jgi:hypothetical protein